MRIKGYRATYGDSNGAHGLLNSAAEIKSAAESIQIFTDNARQQPGKFFPQPFYRGLPQDDYYVVIKTHPDETASRAGMVFSEALFYPLDEAILVSDFSALLSAFSADLAEAKKSKLTEFFILPETSEKRMELGIPNGLISLLNVLIAGDSTNPPVWIGQENFIEILTALWNRVPETFRKNFFFRFCYVPQEFDRFPPVLIYTPTELAARWVQYPRVQPQAENEQPQSEAVAYLLKNDEGRNLKEFLTASEASIKDWQSLKMAEECASYIEKLNSNKITISEFRGLLARVAVLSPDENQGAEYKAKLFEKFCRMNSEKGSFEDVFALNNFALQSFPKSSDALLKNVKEWLNINFWKLTPENLLKLLNKSKETGANIWGKGVIDSVKAMVGRLNQNNLTTLWKWWQADDRVFDLVSDYLPSAKQIDSLLSEFCPRVLNKPLGVKIKEFAQKEKFWQLHAAALTTYLPPVQAIAEQLKTEPAKTAKTGGGLQILFERISLETILEEILKIADERLLQPLAERIVKNARLLRKIDLTKNVWQDLTLLMLENNAVSFWKNLPKPEENIYQIFDLLISCDLIKTEIIRFIADSDFSDVSRYPKRKLIWQYLSFDVQTKFLAATAEAWWKDFNEHVNSGDIPEQPLLDYLWTDNKIENQIRGGENPVNELLKVYKVFPGLSEEYFIKKLSIALHLQTHIDQVTAIRLGKYIYSRNWYRSAKEILRLAEEENRRDLFVVLRECKSLFYFWDRYLSSILSNIFEDRLTWEDWWKAFKELLFERYGDGPSQSNIWNKSGGHNSDLLKKVSGREAWEDAIQKLLAGKAGSKINTPKLLEEIQHEYPSDDKIKLLIKLFYEELDGRF